MQEIKLLKGAHSTPFNGAGEATMSEDAWRRFVGHIDLSDPTGCWSWMSSKSFGYGYFWLNNKRLRAHRLAYEIWVEPIPDGLCLDHLCRNRSCVNPDHLEAVTPTENLMRGESPAALNAAKTHCPKGHPYSGRNLLFSSGSRRCLTCHRERERQRRAKLKEVV